MVRSKVMIKSPDSSWRELGVHSFVVVPRTGEYVEFDDDNGTAQAYQVTGVIHPLCPRDPPSIDLLLVHVTTVREVLERV